MQHIIDLISSDPPIPENLPQNATSSIYNLPQRSSRLGLISSDLIDASLCAHDETDIPAKKRRILPERQSPPRRAEFALGPHEPAFPSSIPTTLFSDDEFCPAPSRPTTSDKQPGPNVDDSDPFVFTSPVARPLRSKPMPSNSNDRIYSAPPPPTFHNRHPRQPDIITLSDDDGQFPKPAGILASGTQDSIDEFSDPFSIPGFTDTIETSEAPKKTMFSSHTTELLASIYADEKSTSVKKVSRIIIRKNNSSGGVTAGEWNLSDEIDEPAKPRRPARKSSKMTPEEKEAKANARAEAKAQKDRERELEKERKAKLREEKARQKQVAADISEVNKLKVDKKDSTPEMIIHIASSLEEGSVGTQTIEFMKRLGVERKFFASPIPNLIKWSRKIKANYNEAAGHWEPCPLRIEEEKHVLCLVPAQDFVDMVISSPGSEEEDTLELHVLKIRSAYPNHKLIYLIEGLTAWMRKNRNSRNRAYQAEFLNPPPPAVRAAENRKNKPENTPPVDDDTIEDALLTLQVTYSCLIHHTNAPGESAEWIKNFTEHISTIPYRQEMMDGNDAAFCMDVGQVKSGEDNSDTFVKMLQEINRVTASMSYGIAGQYPCVTDLIRGMRMHGPTALEDVRKSANRNGALTDSRVGPAASKRLYKVFTGLDPTSTDV
ncbi:hypothetical protein N7454_002513 [Penicillium verhagenii]|nr:hypothetical protein N7454_002513 [Penicillium verhagenii]